MLGGGKHTLEDVLPLKTRNWNKMRLSYLPRVYICMKSLCVNESQLQSDCVCVCVCVKEVLVWIVHVHVCVWGSGL